MTCKGVELDVVRGCVKYQGQQGGSVEKRIENPALPVFASGRDCAKNRTGGIPVGSAGLY